MADGRSRTGEAVMAVGAEVHAPGKLPGLGSVVRAAAMDFYFNSWRLVPANVVWGVSFVALVVVAAAWTPGLALVPFLAIPAAGLYRMAALTVRGEGLGFSDFVAGMARFWRPALLAGVASSVLAVVFSSNLILGLQSASLAGWLFGALALYGDIGLAMMLAAFWPILVDPVREGLSLRECLWLAAKVNLWRPGRMAALTLLLGVLLVASTVLFAALLTVSVAYLSLVATRFVLPIADRLEGRAPAGDRA